MYRIRKEITFEAAHKINGHKDPITGEPGKCAREHGHTYTIAVVVETEQIDHMCMAIDYGYLGDFLKCLYRRWDHTNLNDDAEFRSPMYQSTAERIAFIVYSELVVYIQSMFLSEQTRLRIVYAECKETGSTYARYYPDK